MGKGKKIALFAVITVIAIAGAAYGARAYFVRSMQNATGFLQGTKLNGQNVSGKTPAEAAAMLAEGFDERQAVMIENGKEVFRMPLTELGYTVNTEKLEKVLTEFMDQEKENADSVFDVLVNGNEFTVTLSYTVDKDVFAEKVRVDALTEPRRENVDAKLVYNEKENKYEIEPEVQGTELKEKDIQEWFRKEINDVLTAEQRGESAADADAASAGETAEAAGQAGEAAVSGTSGAETAAANESAGAAEDKKDAAAEGTADANTAAETAKATEEADAVEIVREIPASFYIPPEKTRDNKRLNEKMNVLNSFRDETITYLFGGETETLTFKDFREWLKVEDGKATVREKKVQEYVRGLADKYETRYRDRAFTTTYGNVVTFPANLNEYGYTILEDQEAVQLTQDILSGQSVEREPVYQTLGAWGDPLFLYRNGQDDMAGTYVEVSLSAQHLWYYINGSLFIESDVVTGDVNEGMGTATGVFPLAFKESPATLRGGEGKKKYTTKVQYWMPFYEGQGLHDAWWKTVFGGTEYMGNGSHGCVNLPPSVAESIYNNIQPGTAIVIYN